MSIHEDGFLYILDCAKEVVLRSGENIYSIAVENVLAAHPAAGESAVIGTPDGVLGAEPVAVLRLAATGGAHRAELRCRVCERLAAFQRAPDDWLRRRASAAQPPVARSAGASSRTCSGNVSRRRAVPDRSGG